MGKQVLWYDPRKEYCSDSKGSKYTEVKVDFYTLLITLRQLMDNQEEGFSKR